MGECYLSNGAPSIFITQAVAEEEHNSPVY